jgi:hypothetical protein
MAIFMANPVIALNAQQVGCKKHMSRIAATFKSVFPAYIAPIQTAGVKTPDQACFNQPMPKAAAA